MSIQNDRASGLPPDTMTVSVPPSGVSSMNRVSALVGAISPSATLAVDAKAKALKAKGISVIGFGVGEPDFATPDAIVEAAVAACSDPKNHHYTPAGGLADLKQAIVEKTSRDSGFDSDPAGVLVTNGGKHAVYNTMLTLVDPGDEVLLPAPYWTTYPEPVALAGGTSVVLPTDAAGGFRVTVDQLEAARTERTKALVFVSPSNPSGAVYPRDEILAIGQWAVEHNIWVITDEIYEHLVYGDSVHYSMPALVPELADQCVVLNGVAKTYAMTGWRVGWMIGPADVIKAASNLQSHATSNVANVSQRAALAAITGTLDDVRAMREVFDRRRIRIHSMLNDIEGVECREPEGAFYAFPSFAGVLGSTIGGRTVTSTLELADVVLEQANVAFVAGEAFGAPGYGRFSFALADDDLVEGITRLGRLLAGNAQG